MEMDEQPKRRLVACDEDCGAYAEPDPESPEELRATLEHWVDHSYLSGCSHGC